jgi:hypothetical protein
MPHHGRILSWAAFEISAATGAGGSGVLSASIGGTSMTGGGITITQAATAIGRRIDAAAITANNVFHEGDRLTVGFVPGVGFTASRYNLIAQVLMEPGL